MKKILLVALACLMLMTTAFAADDITVTLDGNAIDFADQAPAIVEGRTLVPLRAIFEALGASVEWDQATKTVSSEKDGVSISLTIGSNTLYKNDEAKELDVPAQILNGRTMVPARAIAEAYGVEVAWEAATRTVVLTSPVVEEVDENLIFALSAETYTGNEGYSFTSGGTVVPEIVANPDDGSDKVLFIHSEKTDGPAWSYFRNNGVKFVPGERYVATFKVKPELTALDTEVSVASFGVCFKYADSAEDGNSKDHGVATLRSENGSWIDGAAVFTMPETMIEDAACSFGIYANPDNGIALSYYIDDVTLSVYDGAAADGVQSAASLAEAKKKESFKFENAKGLVFDYDDDFDLSQASGSDKYIENGNLVMVGVDGFSDTQVYYRNVSYPAKDYAAIAVRFKAENAHVSDNAKAETFQIYFTTDSQDNLSESKSCSADYSECIKDGDWYIAYIVMNGNENWTGNITMLRLDPANDEGTFTIDKFVLIEA